MKKNIINKIKTKFHIRFQISLILLIFIMLGISTFSTISAVLSINKNVSKQKAEQLFDETGLSIRIKLDNQLDKAIQLIGLITTLPEFSTAATEDSKSHPGLPFLIEALEKNSYFYSIYSGFSNGDFMQLIKTSANPLILSAHNAPEQTVYILRTISGNEADRLERWTYLDSNLMTVSSSLNENPEYQPLQRPWFKNAMATPTDVILTEPYIYDSLQKPGITAAASINKNTVAGIDITLADLESFINSIHISPGTGILVLDKKDRILAANENIDKWLDPSNSTFESLDSMLPAERSFISGDAPNKTNNKAVQKLLDKNLLWKSSWVTPGGQEYQLIITAPASDFLEHQQIIQHRIITITAIIFILVLPLIILTSVYLSRFLKNLSIDAEKIQHFNFDGELTDHSPIIEFEELAEAFRIMKKAIAAKTQALETALSKLERIIDLGIAMSVEQNPDKLVEMILKGAKELSGADGGSLYLKGENDELEFKIVLNDSLGFAQGGASGNPISMPPVQLYTENGELNFHNVVSSAYHKQTTIVVDDAYENPDYDFSGTKKFDALNNYLSTSFLTVPLKLQGSDIIGALQLINCLSPEDNEVVPFSKDIQSFIEALSSLAAAILYNRILLDSQDALFESLIQLTATAIDTKSPYTGGHCSRVPVLSQMLAEKAEQADEGPLKFFKFSTPLEKKAFTIGSWLHDAGKMTTPEFVVDKAVKLETIHNRIHEIRTRFEVMLRDARLMEKEALLEGKSPETAAEELRKIENRLFEEFDYIANANSGSTYLPEGFEEKIRIIGKQTWKSHFNHTLGLSSEEQEKFIPPYVKGETIDEPLIADKPQHLIKDKGKTKAKYNDYGFILPHPEYLYNRGEIYNLLIEKGTLTSEERYKINEHIMQTIVMLDQLPFPAGMTKIPEFVSTHHETLTGTGYPWGLKANQLSIPSRIMTIADIFEALTASDRPYKEAKKLSEAIEILYQQTLTKHIDTDLFELFLSSGIYLEYAERFLPEEQIDEVDISKYIR